MNSNHFFWLVIYDNDFFTHIQFPDIVQLLISEPYQPLSTDTNIIGQGINILWLICIVMFRRMHR